LIDSLKSFVDKNSLFSPADHLILSVSGGVDSMVLLDLFRQFPYKLTVAHINHGLRAQESVQDELFVTAQSNNLGIDCFTHNIKEQLAQSKGNKQNNARNLRYRFLEDLRAKIDAQWILTAHHLDDSIETMIHNFYRGTGLNGLTGIKCIQNNLVRPLLFAPKSDILDYADKHQIAYREDSSNLTDDYNRNKIRHHILNSSQPLFDNQISRLSRTLKNLTRSNTLYFNFLEEKKNQLLVSINESISIELVKLLKDNDPAFLAYELTKDLGFNLEQWEDLLIRSGKVAASITSDKYQAVLDRDFIIIKPHDRVSELFQEVLIDKSTSEIRLSEGQKLIISLKDNDQDYNSELLLDYNKIVFPLTIRVWQDGDTFFPQGMGGKSQKVSKTLRNYKVPSSEKAKQLVVLSNNEICCVLPFRVSDQFAPSSETSKLLSLKIAELD